MSAAPTELDRLVSDAVRRATGYGTTRTGRARRHAWSLHVPYRDGGGRDLLAKVPLWHGAPTLEAALAAGPQPATRREFDTLVAFDARAQGEPGLAPVPIVAYAEPANAIVMERIEARTLSRRLGWGRGRGDVGRLMGRVGTAIRLLHEATGGGDRAGFDAAALAARLGEIAASSHLPDRAGGVVQAVRARGESLAGAATATAVLHGDLSQANVLVTADDRVAIIDPNHVRGDVHLDAAHLLTDVTARRDQVITGGLLRPFPLVREWAACLADGHGGLDRGLLEAHWAVALLERWAEVRRRRLGPVAGPVAGRVVESRVSSLVAPQDAAG